MNEQHNDGGPAFPRPCGAAGEVTNWEQDGMSLRDYFLRRFAALGALIAGMDLSSRPDRTAYWSSPRKPQKQKVDKRAKIKAARKQRNRK